MKRGSWTIPPSSRLRSFEAGDIICRKGEYELDLCFIMTGGVDLIDRYGEDDQVLPGRDFRHPLTAPVRWFPSPITTTGNFLAATTYTTGC
jgi:hypothetical protein